MSGYFMRTWITSKPTHNWKQIDYLFKTRDPSEYMENEAKIGFVFMYRDMQSGEKCSMSVKNNIFLWNPAELCHRHVSTGSLSRHSSPWGEVLLYSRGYCWPVCFVLSCFLLKLFLSEIPLRCRHYAKSPIQWLMETRRWKHKHISELKERKKS